MRTEQSRTTVINYFNPRRAVLFFIASNFLFLIVDILLAHSYNKFRLMAEWIPVVYSAFAGFGLLLYALGNKPLHGQRLVMQGVLWLGVAVGVVGFYFHFHGATFREFSLKSLVYAAPLTAPLAYAGLSLAALFTDRLGAQYFGEIRKRILLILVGGGFLGNLLLSIFDHARNGFFVSTEWIPVFVSAFACIVMFWAGFKKKLTREDTISGHIAVGVALLTGIVGFFLHLGANVHGVMPTFLDKFTYGAPIFAPLLFCDIAFLGFLVLLSRDDFEWWIAGRHKTETDIKL